MTFQVRVEMIERAGQGGDVCTVQLQVSHDPIKDHVNHAILLHQRRLSLLLLRRIFSAPLDEWS